MNLHSFNACCNKPGKHGSCPGCKELALSNGVTAEERLQTLLTSVIEIQRLFMVGKPELAASTIKNAIWEAEYGNYER